MQKTTLLFSIFISLFAISCSNSNNKEESKELSNIDKAKLGVIEFLNNNLNDTSSYESLEFGDLEEIKDFDGEDSKILNEYLVNKMFAETEGKDFSEKLELDSSKMVVMFYELRHKYRAANKFGAKVLENTYFKLNKDFKVVDTKTNQEKAMEEAEKEVEELMNQLKDI